MKLFKILRVILLVSIVAVESSAQTSLTPALASSIPSTLDFTPIVSGLAEPVFITHAGDNSNRLFIIQQTGQIRIFKNGNLLSTPFLNISGLVSDFTGSSSELGLLGLAFDPSYASNGHFYITYTTNNNDMTFPYTTTLARYQVSSGNPDLADTSSGTVLLSIPKKYTNHNGGMLAFGPDGYLYLSIGDGGSGGDSDNNAQNLHTLLGKILRLDVNTTPPAGQKYVIPSTNPFYGNSDSTIKKEIWAYGLRNPWRSSFDRLTGDLYIGDVGQNKQEEVNFQANSGIGGQNYGWRILEGNLCFNPSSNCTAPSGYVSPVTIYDHGDNNSFGCSITGGYVYRGSQFPSMQGVYFYGDYCSGKILGLIRNPNSTWTSGLITSTNYLISSFGQDEQGELYLADYGAGTIYHISPVSVTISGNAGVGGATLQYMDNGPQTVIADGSGAYSILVPKGWSGMVTPYKAGYTFTPVSRSYSNLQNNRTAQDYTAEVCVSCADVNVSIAGEPKESYTLPTGGRVTPLYDGINNGPVQVVSTNGTDIIVSERAYRGANYTDWNEMLGFPVEQLTTEYWFPLCDGTGSAQTFISIGNASQTAAEVTVKIAGQILGSYTIPVGGRVTPDCAGINSGPVQVYSTNGTDIIVSERAYRGANYTDWNEMLGFPADQLTTEYWFPLCDGTGNSQTFISIGNASQTPAEVTVKIAGQLFGSYTIPVGGRETPMCTGINNGPVQVYSTNGTDLIVSERAYRGLNFTDWNEMLGLPVEQLTTEYWFPLCDGTGNSQTFISIGNASQTAAQVTVKIAGQILGSYTIPVGGRVTPDCAGINNGPVQVYSTNGTDLIVSERAYRGANFTDWNEMLGLPVEQLTTEYWFPLYDTTGTAQTFLTIGNASP